MIVYLNGMDKYVNIVIDHVVKDDTYVYAYDIDGQLVGMFDVSVIMVLYVTEFQQQNMWDKVNED